MLSEDFDKKIKLAAEQHYPAYDEKAWLKMEKLLGRYLPRQKNDRRKIFFFLLAFLIIGGGTFLVLSKPWKKTSHVTEQLSQGSKNQDQLKNPEKAVDNNISRTHTEADETNTPESRNKNLIVQPQVKETFTAKTTSNHPFPNDQKNAQPLINQRFENKPKNIAVDERNKGKTEPTNTPVLDNSDIEKSLERNNGNKITDNSPKKDEIEENSDKQVVNGQIKKAPQKNKSINKNGFSFSISAGPDVSKAGSSKTGKTTVVYGAGIAYTRNRFTLRTGVYTSKKIYWANPNEYKLSFTPPASTQFEGADANCNVIDIPLKLSYNFGIGNKSNWFAGGGLSSYLMKREKYTYVYKTASGSPYYHNYFAKNEHQHYFSILNLSAGYTRTINNFISVTAEPYAEIPLTGIGAGKVHLNSGGILFTVGIHPFKK